MTMISLFLKIIKDPFVWFTLIMMGILFGVTIHNWSNDNCDNLATMLGCGYNPDKHICEDWGCDYFSPFGSPNIQFHLSQIIFEQSI